MTDVISKARRSENMRRIRSKGTAPEMLVRRLVHSMGFRFRLHRYDLPGKPDMVFPRLKRIVEVRGCFWHQHKGCIDSHIPKSRIAYWRPKLRRNVLRDKRNLQELQRMKWRVLTIWECEIKRDHGAQLRRRLQAFLKP